MTLQQKNKEKLKYFYNGLFTTEDSLCAIYVVLVSIHRPKLKPFAFQNTLVINHDMCVCVCESEFVETENM